MIQADISVFWDQIKDTIQKVIEPLDQRAEDVYAAVKYKQAFFFTCEEGWTIVREQVELGEKVLFIWLAANWSNEHQFCTDKVNEYYKEMARQIGARTVKCASYHKGFDRILPKPWKRDFVVYKMEI